MILQASLSFSSSRVILPISVEEVRFIAVYIIIYLYVCVCVVAKYLKFCYIILFRDKSDTQLLDVFIFMPTLFLPTLFIYCIFYSIQSIQQFYLDILHH